MVESEDLDTSFCSENNYAWLCKLLTFLDWFFDLQSDTGWPERHHSKKRDCFLRCVTQGGSSSLAPGAS